MVHDLYNVREVPSKGRAGREPTPLTAEEERRTRAVLFTELGNRIADDGWATFPAYSPEERRRLVEVGRMLSAHWGIPVTVEAQDVCAMRLSLAGHELRPAGGPGPGGA
ncbi:hypothetical protein [Streptomyces sp. SBT349]|uniref:hypothetical protein n=1 Tax=Streptomyces sp. SBT349 TaxID=1580539 RepID=UPI00066B0778|nr:hypothetical protein [Streptomyces sp. SBT349]